MTKNEGGGGGGGGHTRKRQLSRTAEQTIERDPDRVMIIEGSADAGLTRQPSG